MTVNIHEHGGVSRVNWRWTGNTAGAMAHCAGDGSYSPPLGFCFLPIDAEDQGR